MRYIEQQADEESMSPGSEGMMRDRRRAELRKEYISAMKRRLATSSGALTGKSRKLASEQLWARVKEFMVQARDELAGTLHNLHRMLQATSETLDHHELERCVTSMKCLRFCI